MIYLLLIFGFCVSCLLLFLNARIKRTNFYHNLFEDVEKFRDIDDGLEYINLGSTFANYAFDYSLLGLKGFNFAINGQNLEYDFKLLKHYQDRIMPGAKIFIVCADLELAYISTKDYYKNVRVYKYYKKNILDFGEVPMIPKYYFAYIMFPILKIHTIKYIFHDSEPYNKRTFDKNIMTLEEAGKDAERRINGWESMFNIYDWDKQDMKLSHKKEIDKNICCLKNMIGFCKNKHWKPYIIVPPVSYLLNEKISEKFVERNLISYLRNIANEEDIELFDYSRDERFQSLDLYINSACLNKRGRKEFLETLLNDISNGGIKYE